MRNLKRVLSLALATAMLLGMMVVGSSAADTKVSYADLTDKDQITNKESVSLLVDLGVIEGKPDGTYAPAETVDKGTMAKLICFILMGNVDQNSFKGTPTDLKDITGHWAEGYIKYCYANKIISGDGDGHFNPNNKVTVVEAAKMLNVSLGYVAETQGYVNNSNWSVNIMKDAAYSGITSNLKVSASDALNRDNAALMIYNALFAREAFYNAFTGNTVGFKSSTLGARVYGLSKEVGIVIDNEALAGPSMAGKSRLITPNSDGSYTIYASANTLGAGTLYDINSGKDDLYNEVTFYTTRVVTPNSNQMIDPGVSLGAVIKVLSSAVVSTAKSRVTEVTDFGTKNVSAYTTAKNLKINPNLTAASFTALSGESITLAGAVVPKGTTFQYIDSDGNGIVDFYKAVSYKLSYVVDKNATSNSYPDGRVVLGSVTAGFPGSATFFTSKTTEGFDTVEKGDIVLYSVIGNRLYVEKAQVVTGLLTDKKSDNSSLTVEGKAYGVSALGITPTAASAKGLTTVYTVTTVSANYYLDKNGYVIGTNATAVSNNYMLLLGGSQTISPYGSTYTVLSVDSEGASTTFDLAAPPATALYNAMTTVQWNALASSNTPVMVAYSVNAAGKLVITSATGLTSKTITKGQAQIAPNNFYSSNTKFVFSRLVNGAVTTNTVTGYNNVATITADAAIGNGVPVNGNTYANVVFIHAAPAATGNVTYAYLPNDTFIIGTNSKGYTTYTYNFYIDGEAKALVSSTNDLDAGMVYSFATDADGVNTFTPVVSPVGIVVSNKNVTAVDMGSGYAIIGGSVVPLADKFKVYDVSGDTVVESALAEDQLVTYVTKTTAWNSGTRQELAAAYVLNSVVNAAEPTAASVDTATTVAKSLTVPTGSVNLKLGIAELTGYVVTATEKVDFTITAASGTTVDKITLNGDTTDIKGALTDVTLTAGSNVLHVTVKDDTTNLKTTYNYYLMANV